MPNEFEAHLRVKLQITSYIMLYNQKLRRNDKKAGLSLYADGLMSFRLHTKRSTYH